MPSGSGLGVRTSLTLETVRLPTGSRASSPPLRAVGGLAEPVALEAPPDRRDDDAVLARWWRDAVRRPAADRRG